MNDQTAAATTIRNTLNAVIASDRAQMFWEPVETALAALDEIERELADVHEWLLRANMRLTAKQRETLIDLANVRDKGNTGEAYFYPMGAEYQTAAALVRHGFLRVADSSFMRVYFLTDAGYEEARRAAV